MRLVRAGDLYFVLIVAIVTVTRWLGSRALRERIAAALGALAHRCSRAKRRTSEEAAARALPHLAAVERRRVVQRAFREFWRDVLSAALSRREEATVLRGAEVHGLEHVRAALAVGRGAILWESSDFGRRLTAKQLLKAHGIAIHQVHAENHIGGFQNAEDPGSVLRQRLIQPFFERLERRWVADIIHLPLSDSLLFARLMSRRLRDNHVLCTASDGPKGERFVDVTFLGHRKPFATGVVSLARASGAALLPIFCFEDDEGRTRLTIEPPVHITADREGTLGAYAAVLEAHAMRHPRQYRGWHLLGASGQRGQAPRREGGP